MHTSIYYPDITLPHAAEINYSDAEEVYAYHLLLCKILEHTTGAIRKEGYSAESRSIRNEGCVWLKNVKNLISQTLGLPVACGLQTPHCLTTTLGELPDLLTAYDFMYRVCNRKADSRYIRDAKLKTVQLWLAGDKTISATSVALLIAEEASRDTLMLEKRYYDFYFRLSQKWIDELLVYGNFREIPLHEAYDRLQNIISSDIMSLVGTKQRELKSKWAASYKACNIATLDTKTLKAYIPFACKATMNGYIPESDPCANHTKLCAELATRPDLHPYYRQALQIALYHCETA